MPEFHVIANPNRRGRFRCPRTERRTVEVEARVPPRLQHSVDPAA